MKTKLKDDEIRTQELFAKITGDQMFYILIRDKKGTMAKIEAGRS